MSVLRHNGFRPEHANEPADISIHWSQWLNYVACSLCRMGPLREPQDALEVPHVKGRHTCRRPNSNQSRSGNRKVGPKLRKAQLRSNANCAGALALTWLNPMFPRAAGSNVGHIGLLGPPTGDGSRLGATGKERASRVHCFPIPNYVSRNV